MKVRLPILLSLGLVFATLWTAEAELQSVTVGGEIQIRGHVWMNSFNTRSRPALIGNNIRWRASALGGRPIGDPVAGQTIISFFDWDSRGEDYSVIEQRTRLHLRADFTEGVGAFVEFDSFDVWGEDFRSEYITGVDSRASSSDDVEVFQAYIETIETFGLPLRLRVGRQELVFGSGWLVGDNTAHREFAGLSFDALRVTYATDSFTVDAWWAKLEEGLAGFLDEDIDFFGIYARCHALENVEFDLYWMFIRDDVTVSDTQGGPLLEWMEDALGLDDYDTTYLHTIGLRAAGACAGLDYEVQGAYQFGNADSVGSLFKPFSYGDNAADFDAWAADLEVGYTFNAPWHPRAWIGAAYFQGEDNRDISFWEWLNPFISLRRPESSISFNRLFSNKVYSNFIDEMGELSNFWTIRGGVVASPTETVELGIVCAYFQAVDTFEQPIHLRVGGMRVPLFEPLSFWTTPSDDEIGWELGIWTRYIYSEDLRFEAGWSHFFVGDALCDGNFNDLNGLAFNGGTGDTDAHYLYIETAIRF